MNDDSPLKIPYREKGELKNIKKRSHKKTGKDEDAYPVFLFFALVSLVLLLMLLGLFHFSGSSDRQAHIPNGTIIPVRVIEQPTIIPENQTISSHQS